MAWSMCDWQAANRNPAVTLDVRITATGEDLRLGSERNFGRSTALHFTTTLSRLNILLHILYHIEQGNLLHSPTSEVW